MFLAPLAFVIGVSGGCSTPLDASTAVPAWADWPMPNQPGSQLPNIQRHTVLMVGVDEVVRDDVTGLVWQRYAPDQRFTWRDASAYCAALRLAGGSASASNWRLPSRIELVSLLDLSRTDPSIDLEAFQGTPGEWFWTSSRQSDDPSRSWFAYFYFGYPDTDPQDNAYAARCVRETPGPPHDGPRYDLQNEVVKDLATKLTWQRAIPADGATHAAAAQYCADSTVGGWDDWRLPSLQEMETIVDEGRSNPAADPVVFPQTPAAGFWTATLWAGTPVLAWHVDFDRGGAAYDTATMSYRIRCVRWSP